MVVSMTTRVYVVKLPRDTACIEYLDTSDPGTLSGIIEKKLEIEQS